MPKVKFSTRPKSMRYITRVEHQYMIGWRVKIGQRTAMEVIKFFGDGRHGGKRKALKAAKRFRDKSMLLFGSNGSRPLGRRMAINMKHGLPIGVSYQKRKDRSNGHDSKWVWREYFQAYWQLPDRPGTTKTFSIKKHGYREAKRMAIAWRKSVE